MASLAGLRRGAAVEQQPKGESVPVLGSPDGPGRKPSWQQQQHGVKSRSVISRQGFIGVLTLAGIILLVFRACISLVVVDPALADTVRYSSFSTFASNSAQSNIPRLSSSAHPRLDEKDATYDGSTFVLARPRRTSILAKKPQRIFNSSRNCFADEDLESALGAVSQAYHSPQTFYHDFKEMACQFKIFVYPHSGKDPFAHVFRSYTAPPTGNYASEHYFKMALLNSDLITKDPAEADLFYLPFSIARMRNDPNIGVAGIKGFVSDYVSNISRKYPYWNRSGGADHFYVNCHSIGKTATEKAIHIRNNAIQVVCSSSYHLQVYFPHKDATIPQVWPRTGFPKLAPLIEQRTTLAFFAGAGNSPVRAEVAKHWINDTEIKVYTQRIQTPYDEALLSSKYCLHVKGFEVNTARLADAMHYGCVPIIIANHHDLPFNDVLDWRRFSLVVTTDDIPKLKDIIKAVGDEEYFEMQKSVMQVRQHFQWHKQPQHFDAFYMVMYELWLRRHVVRFPFLIR